MNESTTPKPHVVRRPAVIRRLLALYEKPRYLEIGVCEGATFHKVEAAYKVAVDPEFRFDQQAAARENPTASYHEVPSDEYFGSIVGEDEQFDVIFLDGLHTVEQTLRDLTNALPHLQPRGVIVIDDVTPPTYLASLPDRANFFEVRRHLGSSDQRWMGDVYKLVYFMDTFFQQLTYRTIRNNHGQAVVWRQRRESVTDRSLNAIGSLTFEQFALEQDTLHLTRFGDIVDEVRAAIER